MNNLRPIQHLNATLKSYPATPRFVDEFRLSRGKSLPHWPDWCFLPMAAWYAMVSARHNTEKVHPDSLGEVSRLAAIGTWRYSQGIYRVDPDLMPALAESRVSGKLPSEVLFRLPEWSLYVETPCQKWQGDELHGFWAHLESDANTERTELRFLFDCETDLIGLPLHIGDWSIGEAVEKAFAEADKQARRAGLPSPAVASDVTDIAQDLNGLVSALLYLCSEEPEIDDTREPGMSPSYPKPKKTKKGWRLFSPDKPRIWSVGARTGALLRNSSIAGEASGRSVRTHLRRAHWHGYWTGPRSGERRFVYRWISPLIVGGQGA